MICGERLAGSVRFDPGKRKMTDHDAHHAVLHQSSEGNEFQCLEPVRPEKEHRQRHVRIDGGIPMARKMLCGGEHAGFLQPEGKGRRHTRDNFRPLTERTGVDDRIVGVVVYVGYGSKYVPRSDSPCLPACDVPGHARPFDVSCGAHRHGPWKDSRPLNAHPRTPLHILGNKQREPRTTLQVIHEGDLIRWVSLKKGDAAESKLLDQIDEVLVCGIVRVHHPAIGAHGKQLGDLLFQRHGPELLFGPCFRTGPEVVRIGRTGENVCQKQDIRNDQRTERKGGAEQKTTVEETGHCGALRQILIRMPKYTGKTTAFYRMVRSERISNGSA